LAAGISTIDCKQETFWSAAEKAHSRKEDERGDLDSLTLSKDGAGSSGCVKRKYLDSRTPPLEKTANKKPRNAQGQSGKYKETVVGIKMAIIHRRHPDVILDQN
jgi:Ni,Fe-hydrogenase I small subunit